jgi:hypothetical protein
MRFLHEPYFTTPIENLKAMLLVQSPQAFRRRLIFTEAEPLRRARMPRAAAPLRPLFCGDNPCSATILVWQNSDARKLRPAGIAAQSTRVLKWDEHWTPALKNRSAVRALLRLT